MWWIRGNQWVRFKAAHMTYYAKMANHHCFQRSLCVLLSNVSIELWTFFFLLTRRKNRKMIDISCHFFLLSIFNEALAAGLNEPVCIWVCNATQFSMKYISAAANRCIRYYYYYWCMSVNHRSLPNEPYTHRINIFAGNGKYRLFAQILSLIILVHVLSSNTA